MANTTAITYGSRKRSAAQANLSESENLQIGQEKRRRQRNPSRRQQLLSKYSSQTYLEIHSYDQP
jgi:hypothetical protein